MKRQKIKKQLLEFGYSEDTIEKIFQLRMKPTADKMFELNDKFKIPLNAWRDIKSYLQENDNTRALSKINAKDTKSI